MNLSEGRVQRRQDYKLYLKNTVEKGRGLYIKCHNLIPRGTILFTSSPYTFVLNYEYWGTHCFNCFESGQKQLKRCLACQCVLYCSVDCQKQDWIYHKGECKALLSFVRECMKCHLVAEEITDLVLVARTLRKLRLDKNMIPLISLQETLLKANSECLSTHWNFVESMCVTHELQKNVNGMKGLIRTQLLRSLITCKEELCVWLTMFQCNNFGITDDRMVCIGVGVYAIASLLNHSCCPNCIYTFDPLTKNQVCRSIQDLNSDDELLIPYIDIVFSTKERQAMLYSLYGFRCSCHVCNNPIALKSLNVNTLDEALCGDKWGRQLCDIPWSSFATLLTKTNQLMDGNRKLILQSIRNQLTFSSSSPTISLQTVFNWVTFVKQCFVTNEESDDASYQDELFILETLLHPLNLELYSKRCQVFSLALEQKNYCLAIQLGEHMTNFLNVVYQHCPYYPLLGLHYYTMYDLYLELGNTLLAQEYHKKTYACLKICYGMDHPFVLALR